MPASVDAVTPFGHSRNSLAKALPEAVSVSATIFRFVSDAKQAKRFFVSGFVQGVGYRYFARDAAERLHLAGYVRNLRDSRVEAYAIGTPAKLVEFRAALERGPWSARVTEVTEETAGIDAQYAKEFVITYDG
jgi:acylphosphatase